MNKLANLPARLDLNIVSSLLAVHGSFRTQLIDVGVSPPPPPPPPMGT